MFSIYVWEKKILKTELHTKVFTISWIDVFNIRLGKKDPRKLNYIQKKLVMLHTRN